MSNILNEISHLAEKLKDIFEEDITNKKFIDPYKFYLTLQNFGYQKGEQQRQVIAMLYSYSLETNDRRLQEMFPLLVDIPRLWKWTKKDLSDIYLSTFASKIEQNRGPSNTFTLTIAAFFDIWGSILNEKFGERNYGQTKKNIKKVLRLLQIDYPEDYPADLKMIPNIFRNNLIHCFGKDPKGPPFDLDIGVEGKSIEFLTIEGRWHINCLKIHRQFLDTFEKALIQKFPTIRDIITKNNKEIDTFLKCLKKSKKKYNC